MRTARSDVAAVASGARCSASTGASNVATGNDVGAKSGKGRKWVGCDQSAGEVELGFESSRGAASLSGATGGAGRNSPNAMLCRFPTESFRAHTAWLVPLPPAAKEELETLSALPRRACAGSGAEVDGGRAWRIEWSRIVG